METKMTKKPPMFTVREDRFHKLVRLGDERMAEIDARNALRDKLTRERDAARAAEDAARDEKSRKQRYRSDDRDSSYFESACVYVAWSNM